MTATEITYVPTLDYLAWVVRQARIDGALVTGKYEARDRQTWHRAITAYDSHRESLSPEGNPSVYGPTLHEETTEAHAMLAYFRAQSPEEQQSDYLLDLVVLLADDTIRRDRLALAASGLVVYRRAMEARERAEQAKKQRQESTHLGTIGQWVEPIVTVAARWDRVGRMSQYRLVTQYGHILTYFGPPDLMNAGWIYRVSGKIKRHEEYKGEKRTVIIGNWNDVTVIEEGSHAGPQAPHIARGA